MLVLSILYIDIIIETEEKTKIELKAVVTHMANRGWQINPANTQEPNQTLKFLGLTWAGAICGIPQVKETAVLACLWNKAISSAPGLITQIWRTHIPHLKILVAPNHKSTQKRIIFEWEPENIRR